MNSPHGKRLPVLRSGRPDAAVQAALVEVWESSVAATHDFISPDDRNALKPLVAEALASIDLIWLEESPELPGKESSGRPVAFMAVEGDKVEMLFVAPALRGQGLGRMLLEHAVHVLAARHVDVNEQNPQAAGFYRRMGFRVAGRSPLDGQGKPFPLLHLTLDPEQKTDSC